MAWEERDEDREEKTRRMQGLAEAENTKLDPMNQSANQIQMGLV